jgi:hypothetical protein
MNYLRILLLLLFTQNIYASTNSTIVRCHLDLGNLDFIPKIAKVDRILTANGYLYVGNIWKSYEPEPPVENGYILDAYLKKNMIQFIGSFFNLSLKKYPDHWWGRMDAGGSITGPCLVDEAVLSLIL